MALRLPPILRRLLPCPGSGAPPPREGRPGKGAGGLDAAALKDIGLTPGDLPAIERGIFSQDASRRQR